MFPALEENISGSGLVLSLWREWTEVGNNDSLWAAVAGMNQRRAQLKKTPESRVTLRIETPLTAGF